MPVYGSLEKFHRDQDWGRYIAVLKNYFGANGITDSEKKRQILLASVGLETYDLICTLVSPLEPEAKSFEELVKLVQEHVQPPPSKIVSRFKFYTLCRGEGESISSFVVKLRQAAQDCKFTDLNEHLRDRFIVAIGDDKIQTRLLSMSDDVTFSSALQEALAMESAQSNAENIKAAATASSASVSGASAVCAVQETRSAAKGVCYGCGGDHYRRYCRFRDAVCRACSRKGHISKVCRTQVRRERPRSSSPVRKDKRDKRKTTRSTHLVDQDDPVSSGDSDVECYVINSMDTLKCSPIEIPIQVQSRNLMMQVDTGAAISLISKSTYEKTFSDIPLECFRNRLTTYTGEVMKVHGCAKVAVQYGDQHVRDLPLVVVERDGPSLLGRNWLLRIRLDWPKVCSVLQNNVEDIVGKYPEMFRCSLGEYKGSPVKLFIDETAKPLFFKARPVPYAIKGKVQEAIEKNVQLGIWQPVDYSDWAAPLVPIVKNDGSVRLCGDYKITINQVCRVDPYPLPRIEDIFAELRGGKKFSKIDLHSAYSEIPVHEDFQEYLTVNTHLGLFRVKRLPFGVNAAVGIFQRIISNVLKGLVGVSVYLDDILITGKDDREHLHNLEQVLMRLKLAGLQAKKKKCSFLQASVEYLGHRIDAEGLHPTNEKVRAVKEAPNPSNKTELRSFLGLINYYAKFLPNLSNILSPLYNLTKKDVAWRWGKAERAAFQRATGLISISQVLVHYNPDLPRLIEKD